MSLKIEAAARRAAQLASHRAGGPHLQQAFGATAPAGASFGDNLKRAIEQVSATQETAAATMQAFLRGEQVELHQVMAASEEAGIAVEMLVEIRNKFAEAYRTLVNMQS